MMTTRGEAMLERIASALELAAIERVLRRMPSSNEAAAMLRSIAASYVEHMSEGDLEICDECGGRGCKVAPSNRIDGVAEPVECSECGGEGFVVATEHAATHPPPSEPSAP